MEKGELYNQLLKSKFKMKQIENLDERLEEILTLYYGRNIPFNSYLNSKNKLMRALIQDSFPTVEKWNDIAEKEGYLSHISLEYIEQCNWKGIKIKLKKELKTVLFKKD